MDKIAVLIPCYNESATIAKVVKDYRAAPPAPSCATSGGRVRAT